jgi:hypothetical protein
MLVTLSIIAIVMAVSIPAFYAVREGFNSHGTDTLVSAALASAKAIAVKEQRYAGIRFQCVPDRQRPDEPGDQYLIFIIQDPALQKIGVNCFRAVNGVAPIKLPVNQGVIDIDNISSDADIDSVAELWDHLTFSIVFSPSGRLVTHKVKVWNRDAKPAAVDTSQDIVFNTKTNVNLALQDNPTLPANTTGCGMFYQDDGAVPGLGEEESRLKILIFDRKDFRKAPPASRWSACLRRLAENETLYINPYTGTIIENRNRASAAR